MTEKETAIISSTARDLPEYRDSVMHSCLRLDVFPKMMEHLPALDADAIAASLALVDKADIYVGIFAHRYGYVPKENNPRQLSITEMEYERAVERKIPRLIFLMDENYAVKPADFDKGTAAEKLEAFKKRLSAERVRDTFTTEEDLCGKVIHALGELRKSKEIGQKAVPDFHPPSLIPTPPEPYVPHPYSLLQTKDLIGRQAELSLLTDWATTHVRVPADTRIFTLVAIGGMGKSALTWKWFNDIAPNELPGITGCIWWSFYESDAHWDNFIIRALAYVSGQSEKVVREMQSPEREDQLWRILDRQPFLVVLDGLERILLAYARMDAAQMPDDDLDEQTSNRVAKAHGLPESAGESFIGRHQLRCTADHRAGQFLRRLARMRLSRVLVTTRLYPAELQTETGDTMPGCFASFLTGLRDEDAVALWREFKVTGARQQLLPLFRSFDNYPLLLRALAGEVAGYRPAPRDFDKWRQAHPQFDPAGLPLKNAKTHVLEYALRGLGNTQRKVLHTLAAFRMPATWGTLRALLVESAKLPLPRRLGVSSEPQQPAEDGVEGRHSTSNNTGKPCADDRALDVVLSELEDRGLLGWDRQRNRYDLHPIVRSVLWQALDPSARKDIYGELHTYFDAIPRPHQGKKVESIEDLTPAMELFHSLIGLERYDDAFSICREHLFHYLYYRLGALQVCVDLMEQVFPDHTHTFPKLHAEEDQCWALNSLACAYNLTGRPTKAIALCRQKYRMDRHGKRPREMSISLRNLAEPLLATGRLREATRRAFQALGHDREQIDHFREGVSLRIIGTVLAACGERSRPWTCLRRARAIYLASKDEQGLGIVTAHFAQYALWHGGNEEALQQAKTAWSYAESERFERDFVRAARLHGAAALGLGDSTLASERLQHALTRARAANLVEEELIALTWLAELHRQRNQNAVAYELLECVWTPANEGPYPLWHADALNVLAQIERDLGCREAAIAAATKAYALAWCDGPPYAYQHGLSNARTHLQKLGVTEPQLLPFAESKFQPIPDLELNPKDDFWPDPVNPASQS